METPSDLILCSTARLARSIRLAHAADQRNMGMKQWLPLQVLTLSQWLAGLAQRADCGFEYSPVADCRRRPCGVPYRAARRTRRRSGVLK